MSQLSKAVVLLVALLITSQAFAQDHCNALLTSGLRNIQSSSSAAAWDNWAFDKACRQSQSGWKIDATIPIAEGIIGLFGSQQAADKFCQEHAQQQRGATSSSFFSSLVYDKALDAWVACLQLNSDKVRFTPQVDASLQKVVIGVKRVSGNRQSINMVSYEGVENCVISGTSRSGKSVVVQATQGRPVDLRLEGEDSYSVTCQRKSRVGPKGETIFERGQITVHTTAGDLRVPFDYGESYSPSASGAIEEKIASLSKENNDLKKEIESLRRSLPTGLALNCGRVGWATGINRDFRCPGQQVLQGFVPGQQGHGNYDLWCCDAATK